MDQIGFTPTDKLLMIFVTVIFPERWKKNNVDILINQFLFAVDFVVFVSANQRPVKPTN